MNHDHVLQEAKVAEVTPLQKTLSEVKARLGFRSSRSFYDQHLMEHTRLDFNYSYYMKIEGGKINPSSQIISNLCSAFGEEDAQEIMLSYCETIFPERAAVFRRAKNPKKNANLVAIAQPLATSSGTLNQTHLTPAQIACLSQSKIYYFAFLLLTLARRPIRLNDLKIALPEFEIKTDSVERLIEDFTKAKLIKVQNGQISSIANDMKFPASDSASLKKLYGQMDAWSIAFQQELHFSPVVQKMMLRRVSARYLSVIQAHCNVLIDLIRASDEIDPEQNDEVLMLNVSIQRGNLPG